MKKIPGTVGHYFLTNNYLGSTRLKISVKSSDVLADGKVRPYRQSARVEPRNNDRKLYGSLIVLLQRDKFLDIVGLHLTSAYARFEPKQSHEMAKFMKPQYAKHKLLHKFKLAFGNDDIYYNVLSVCRLGLNLNVSAI